MFIYKWFCDPEFILSTKVISAILRKSVAADLLRALQVQALLLTPLFQTHGLCVTSSGRIAVLHHNLAPQLSAEKMPKNWLETIYISGGETIHYIQSHMIYSHTAWLCAKSWSCVC